MKHQMPTPLFRKALFTAIIGIGCLLVSTVYCIGTKDFVLLYLGVIVFCACLWKSWSVYRISVKERFELFEGTCMTITRKPVGKLQTIKIANDEGVESMLRISKNCRLKIGGKYRFYFSEANNQLTGNEYLDTALSTNSFLAYEAMDR